MIQILFIISIICLIISIILFTNVKKKNDNNKELEEKENKIKEQIIELEHSYKEKSIAENMLVEKLNMLGRQIQLNKETMRESLSQYVDLLDSLYEKKEKEYDDALDAMKYAYNLAQDELIAETANIQKDLDKIRATRIAAQEAILKEKKIKEQLDFYCLHPSQEDLDDIQTLERIKSKLHQPRILCMLIWSTYYQKAMTALCNNVLGTERISGIYKITNQETEQCYIGQAVS